MSYFIKIGTVFNTIKYLRPIQVAYQIKGRLHNHDRFSNYQSDKKEVNDVKVRNIQLLIPELDCDSDYLSRFDIKEILNGKVTLLHHTFTFNDKWYDDTASHLENFNLQYFEYAIPLAVEYQRTLDEQNKAFLRNLYNNWQKNCSCGNSVNNNDAQHPYTISLRITNLLISGLTLKDDSIIKSLYPQYRYLIRHQEKALLGNHYFENLEAIVLCGIVFEEDAIYDKYIKEFIHELDIQVLPDGVHYELSLMYHKIVFEGICRVAYALKQVGKPEYKTLLPTIQRMTTALASIEKGMGKTPLFNDSGDGVAKDGKTLLKAAKKLFCIEPEYKAVFPDSGYYKLYGGNAALLFDAGQIGPDYMPGHGQCDCLSFELSVNCTPLFVNSGTYQYQGKMRRYFRSTRAHNTAMVDNREQSECWGEHRVARRIHDVQGDFEGVQEGSKFHQAVVEGHSNGQAVYGAYTSYFGDRHERTITLRNGLLCVLDRILTKVEGDSIVQSYLHLANGYTVTENADGYVVHNKEKKVCCIKPSHSSCLVHSTGEHSDNELTNYAPEFGLLHKTTCLEFIWPVDENVHGYEIRIGDEQDD